jgi:hypothetical protein
MNLLMCLEVVVVLPPLQQAYLRMTGRLGYATFEELIERSGATAGCGGDYYSGCVVPMFMEVTDPYSVRGLGGGSWEVLQSFSATDVSSSPSTSGAAALLVRIPVSHSSHSIRSSPHRKERTLIGERRIYSNPSIAKKAPSIFPGVLYVSHRALMEVMIRRGGETDPFVGWWEEVPWDYIVYSFNSSATSVGTQLNTIPVGFMTGAPATYVRVEVSGGHQVPTSIPDEFLHLCSNLVAFDLAGMLRGCSTGFITAVGGWFMAGCGSLEEIDLTPLFGVDTIGPSFLEGCSALAEIKGLPALCNIVHIDDGFLAGCSGLTGDLDLSSLVAVKTIGSSFLEGCTGLISLSLPPGVDITSIGVLFLAGCERLVTVDQELLDS